MEAFNEKGSRFAGLEIFCDGRICTEDGFEFPIHRVILSAKSDYFKALFGSAINPFPQKDILISQISGHTLKNILGYVYTGSISISSSNICELLVASDYLLMESLLSECLASVDRTISSDNCFELLNVAQVITHLGIYHICYRYFQTHFNLLMGHLASKEMPFYSLACLLTDNSLNVENEEIVWEGIVKWVSKTTEERLELVPILLLCLRLEDATEELVQKIIDHPYVLENEFCSKLLYLLTQTSEGTLKNRFVQAARDLSSIPLYLGPRQPRRRFLFIKYCHFQKELTDGIKVYLTYDENIDRWWKMGKRLDFCPESIVAVGQIVFMFDPWEGICCGLDLLQKVWLEMAPMIEIRREFSVVRLNHSIYCIGGISSTNDVNPRPSVERYEVEWNQWTRVSPMPTAAQGQSETLDGLIYTLGEYFNPEQNSYIMVAQVYDPVSDMWTSFSIPQVYRRHFALIAFRGSLYVIGGNDDMYYLNTVERYDVQEGLWTVFQDLPEKYYLPKAVVLNGILIVYDNHSDDRKYYKTSPPVYWDEDNNKWQIVHTSSFYNDLYRSQFCVIDGVEVNKNLRSMMKNAKWSSPFRKRC